MVRIPSTKTRSAPASSDDHEVRIASPIARCTHLLNHLVARYHLLSLEKSATLRPHLVLDVQCCGPCVLELLDGADHVERIPIARIGVTDRWDLDGSADATRIRHHLAHGEKPEVGHSTRCRRTEAGHVHGAEAGLLGDHCLQPIVYEGRDDQTRLSQSRAKPLADQGHGNLPVGVLAMIIPGGSLVAPPLGGEPGRPVPGSYASW
jgi:hypothetical protein